MSEKSLPCQTGHKWTDEEEELLLEELSINPDIKLIAQKHNRTTGGINARRKLIAFKLYTANNSFIDIMLKTKLNEQQITEAINKEETNTPLSETKKRKTQETEKPFSIETEIYEIKSDIKILQNTVNELVGMIKAIYEFEDA